jgi:hypothetical protein
VAFISVILHVSEASITIRKPVVYVMFNHRPLAECPSLAAPLPEAPPAEPETEPRPEPEAPPQQQPDLDPFNPPWPAGRPEPQPKA